MLSYRHAFHAGNPADVLKHSIVALIASYLVQKDKPFLYLETHAGGGDYDLDSEPALETGEHREGIARLWGRSDLPPALQPYLDVVKALNSSGKLRRYPGSPRIARHYLRPSDRMELFELHPAEHRLLSRRFAGDRRVAVHRQDGFAALKTLLPPPERRAFVLLDPAYEVKTDYRTVVEALWAGYRRFATGVYALWYPILPSRTAAGLQQALTDAGIQKVLAAELRTRPPDTPIGMSGSGLLIVNPPWRLEQQLTELLPWLANELSPSRQGSWRLQWLPN